MALQKAIEIAGGQSSLAALIDASPQVVNNWVRRGGRTPIENCPAIERATSGLVTCEQLRDDIAWVRVPDPGWPHHPAGRPLVDHAKKAA